MAAWTQQADPTTTQQAAEAGASEGQQNGHLPLPSSAVTPAATSGDKLLDKFNSTWHALQTGPGEFSDWVSLLATAEKLDDISKLRLAYDTFLSEYPLCYGYWKKYAAAEARHNPSHEVVRSIYERGVAAIACSVDLWASYCAFELSINASAEAMVSLFERGLAFVGRDYLACGLWEKLVQYQLGLGAYREVAALYCRMLRVPMQDLGRCFARFTNFCNGRSLGDLVADEEAVELLTQLEEAAHTAAPPAGAVAASPAGAEERADAEDFTWSRQGAHWRSAHNHSPAGCSEQQGAMIGPIPRGEARPAAPHQRCLPNGNPATQRDAAEHCGCSRSSSGPVEVTEAMMKAHWVAVREAEYRATRQELQRCRVYEDAIKRPYFHVKPLDGLQLLTWSRYLEYAEREFGDPFAVVHLYERCLVACASYPEFWMRYVGYLEATDTPAALHVLHRATQQHCRRRAEMHLFAARCLERHGHPAEARNSYDVVHQQLAPGLIEAALQRANFERRQGCKEAAVIAYQAAIAHATEHGAEGTVVFLTLQLADFLCTHYADTERARAAVDAALQQLPVNKVLWEGAIHFEEGIASSDRAEHVLAMYTRATTGVMPSPFREEFSLRSITFADSAGPAELLRQAEREHTTLFALPGHVVADAASRKRAFDTIAPQPGKEQRMGTGIGALQHMPSATEPVFVSAFYPQQPPLSTAPNAPGDQISASITHSAWPAVGMPWHAATAFTN